MRSKFESWLGLDSLFYSFSLSSLIGFHLLQGTAIGSLFEGEICDFPAARSFSAVFSCVPRVLLIHYDGGGRRE